MQCLSGFELYSRWVPLLGRPKLEFGSSHETFDVWPMPKIVYSLRTGSLVRVQEKSPSPKFIWFVAN